MILITFLAACYLFAWVVFETSREAFEQRKEREANQVCRNLAGYQVPCPTKEKDVE